MESTLGALPSLTSQRSASPMQQELEARMTRLLLNAVPSNNKIWLVQARQIWIIKLLMLTLMMLIRNRSQVNRMESLRKSVKMDQLIMEDRPLTVSALVLALWQMPLQWTSVPITTNFQIKMAPIAQFLLTVPPKLSQTWVPGDQLARNHSLELVKIVEIIQRMRVHNLSPAATPTYRTTHRRCKWWSRLMLCPPIEGLTLLPHSCPKWH